MKRAATVIGCVVVFVVYVYVYDIIKLRSYIRWICCVMLILLISHHSLLISKELCFVVKETSVTCGSDLCSLYESVDGSEWFVVSHWTQRKPWQIGLSCYVHVKFYISIVGLPSLLHHSTPRQENCCWAASSCHLSCNICTGIPHLGEKCEHPAVTGSSAFTGMSRISVI